MNNENEIKNGGVALDVIKAIFFASIPLSLVLSYKVVDVYGLTFVAGAVVYAIMFPCTDIITEIWGVDEAKKVVRAGLVVYILTGIIVAVAIYLPPASFFEPNEAKYEEVFGLAPRLVVAAIITYFVAQLNDVMLFSRIRKITKGEKLWLRNIGSTAVSQAIDTILFLALSFWGVFPLEVLISMMIGQYIIKLMIAFADTPIVYASVAILRPRNRS